jgi:hypothetical protein
MANDLKIFYDDKDVFSGIAPTPFFSFYQEFVDLNYVHPAQRSIVPGWNQITNLRLEGNLTGRFIGPLSFQSLNNSVKQLFSGFTGNYKSLKIYSGVSPIFIADQVIINSINIDETNWYGLLPFNIDMTLYDPELFTTYYGVVEPQETYSFSEEDGQILTLTHSLSAKGFATPAGQNNTPARNAIENAKHWVSGRTGAYLPIYLAGGSPLSSPTMIVSDNTLKKWILMDSKESIDRFNGVYSWEGNYKKATNNEVPYGTLYSYTIDISSGLNDGLINVSMDGTLQGGTGDINVLRSLMTGQRSRDLNFYTTCNNFAIDVCNPISKKSVLSNRPISLSINEISGENTISFNVSYNNDFSSDIINNYTVDINQDVLTCITTVNFKADITAKYGDISTRWQKVLDFYNQDFKPAGLVNEAYQRELGTLQNGQLILPNTSLNLTPISRSLTFDENNARITYSATYDDKARAYDESLLSLSSTVTYTPSVSIYSPHVSAFEARNHNIQNLGCATRSSLKIDVTAIGKLDTSFIIVQNAAESEIARIKSYYFGNIGRNNILLESSNISTNKDTKNVTISEYLSFEGIIMGGEAE